MAGNEQRNVLPASAIEVRDPIASIEDTDADRFITVQEALEQVAGRVVDLEEATPAGTSVGATLATVHVSSAELLAMSTPNLPDPATTVELVAAPGAGKIIVPIHVSWRLNYGTTPYSLPSGMFFVITTTPLWASTVDGDGGFGDLWVEFACTGFIDQSTSMVRVVPNNPSDAIDSSLLENQPLLCQNDRPGHYADGDGTLDISVLYYLADA